VRLAGADSPDLITARCSDDVRLLAFYKGQEDLICAENTMFVLILFSYQPVKQHKLTDRPILQCDLPLLLLLQKYTLLVSSGYQATFSDLK